MRSSIHAGLRLFPSYIFYWMPSASLRRCEQPINTSPPEGGEQAPNFGPSSGGPARPPALRIPTPTSGAGPPGDACGIVVAPMALVASLRPRNTGLSGRAGGRRVGGYVAPRVVGLWACEGFGMR